MYNEHEYMYMCPAENKQVFLSFYSYLNMTGSEKREKKNAKSINEMNPSDRRPLPLSMEHS
jgi:hypothetical protein